MKYMYPAVFTPEEDGKYSINFPDLEGCYTCGNDLQDGIRTASDVLYTVLREYEKVDKDIPLPTDPSRLCGLVYCVEIDTEREDYSVCVLAYEEGKL